MGGCRRLSGGVNGRIQFGSCSVGVEALGVVAVSTLGLRGLDAAWCCDMDRRGGWGGWGGMGMLSGGQVDYRECLCTQH